MESEAAITIILMSGKNLPPEFEEGLINVIHNVRGDKPLVRIFPVLAARQRPPANQGIQ